jgi:DNA-binding MarR family transcriptional regulator
MPEALSYELHKLTARLDRAADGLLRRETGVSYSRFLALFAVRQSSGTQRDIARWLGRSEPSTSRMVGMLAADGLLTATRTTGAGNRREVKLTDKGARLVEQCSQMLEARFAEMVDLSGVPYGTYQRYTRQLLKQLDSDQNAFNPAEGAP